MATYDWVIEGGDVVSGSGVHAADVAISDGVVAAVEPHIDPGTARDSYDARGKLVFPGLIDAHNHPYYQDDIEAFSLSAARGGVTTLIPFAGRPWASHRQASNVTQMVEEFIADGRKRSHLDFGVHVILSGGDDVDEVVPELLGHGITSYKVFMAFPGNRMLTDDHILEVMEMLGASGGLCMVHCENGMAIEHLEQRFIKEGRTTPADYVRSRPPQLESEAVYRALALAEVAGCDCYIVHVSAAESMSVVKHFRERPGPRRLAETSPHYLLLDHYDLERLGGRAKISPPMREPGDKDDLWEHLRDGVVDVIASDCSGQTCIVKEQGEPNIFEVPFGIPGVEQLFPLVFDEGVHRRQLSLQTLARVFAENPADIFGIGDRKGRLQPGKDGDVVVFDPGYAWTVHGADQFGNSDYSLYEGRALVGKAVMTMQRGSVVMRDGEVVASAGAGRFLAGHTVAGTA
jgi:dihydropyrimidinase